MYFIFFFRAFNDIVGAIARLKGKKIFAKGAVKAVAKYCKELGLHHTSQTVTCYDNKGKAYQRTMSQVANVDLFLRAVGLIGDDGEVPDLVVSADGSQEKLIIVVWAADEPNAEPFLLCAIDKAHENRSNIDLMLKALGLPWKYKGKYSAFSSPFLVLF